MPPPPLYKWVGPDVSLWRVKVPPQPSGNIKPIQAMFFPEGKVNISKTIQEKNNTCFLIKITIHQIISFQMKNMYIWFQQETQLSLCDNFYLS